MRQPCEVRDMKGFIEYREREDGVRILRSVASITCIFETADGGVFVQTGATRRDEPIGDYAEGTFDEFKQKISSEV